MYSYMYRYFKWDSKSTMWEWKKSINWASSKLKTYAWQKILLRKWKKPQIGGKPFIKIYIWQRIYIQNNNLKKRSQNSVRQHTNQRNRPKDIKKTVLKKTHKWQINAWKNVLIQHTGLLGNANWNCTEMLPHIH